MITNHRKKIHNLEIHYIWKYKELLESKKAIECKLVFRIKYNSNRSVKKFKARLIVQRFSQIYRINYIEIFTPILYQKSKESSNLCNSLETYNLENKYSQSIF